MDDRKTIRVLMVDDDQDDYLILKSFFSQIKTGSFILNRAASYEEALEMMTEQDHDVYMVDYQIGPRTGLELLQEMMKRGCKAPVIILSTLDSSEVDTTAMDLGAVDYLTKGKIDSSILERTIRYSLKHKQTENILKELSQVRTELLHSEKMAMIGQLAAGVAHEINNPIGFVMSNLGTLSDYVRLFKQLLSYYQRVQAILEQQGIAEAEIKELIAQAEELSKKEDLNFVLEDVDTLLVESKEGTKRIQEIVQGLKSFVRLDETHTKEANIHECLESTLKVAANELKYKCEIHKKYGELPNVYCNPGQLNQVFMNLLVNAAQAIPTHGEIMIETQTIDTDIVIRISDTGSGMTPEIMSQIFNPFFTTKPVGKGTGLGLSVSYGIIQSHNGTIDVKSEVGKGTTFTITLPIMGEPADEKALHPVC